MTNKDLIKNWKKISLQFKSSINTKPLTETFLVCAGEMNIDVEGKQETVLVFYIGLADCSPTIFLTSDDKNNCYVYPFNSEKNTHVKTKVGKLLNLEPKPTKKKK